MTRFFTLGPKGDHVGGKKLGDPCEVALAVIVDEGRTVSSVRLRTRTRIGSFARTILR
jgi:hypothetical protein